MILSTEAPCSHRNFSVHIWGLRALPPRSRVLVNAETKLQSQTGWISPCFLCLRRAFSSPGPGQSTNQASFIQATTFLKQLN